MSKKSKKKPSQNGHPKRAGGAPPGRAAGQVRVRQAPGQSAWELVHPRCAIERADDLAEVQSMIAAGEMEIATDELRWLLNGCGDFIAAHRLLGEIALVDSDIPLARGHFGYGFEVGQKALKEAGMPSPVPYQLEGNQAFHEAGKGLVYCLKQLNKLDLARRICDVLIACDPTDPLAVRALLDS